MKKKNKRIRKSDDYNQVLKVLMAEANKPLNYKQIAAKLDDIDKREVGEILELLVRDNKIERKDRGQYIYIKTRDEIRGI